MTKVGFMVLWRGRHPMYEFADGILWIHDTRSSCFRRRRDAEESLRRTMRFWNAEVEAKYRKAYTIVRVSR